MQLGHVEQHAINCMVSALQTVLQSVLRRASKAAQNEHDREQSWSSKQSWSLADEHVLTASVCFPRHDQLKPQRQRHDFS